MTLPVSSYEELLTRVRSLTQETRQLQRQLDSPLLDQNDNEHSMNSWDTPGTGWNFTPRAPPSLNATTPDTLLTSADGEPDPKVVGSQCNGVLARLLGWPSKEEVTGPETKEQDEKKTPETSVSGDGVVQKWGAEYNVWHSVGPIHSSMSSSSSAQTPIKQDDSGSRSYSQQQLGAKVEMVYSLLSMLGTHDREKMTTTLLAMSSSPDSCQAMRQSGCVPLLVQLVHAREESAVVRERASQALHNVVHCHADDKRGRREARVLRLLQQLIDFADAAPPARSADQEGQGEDAHPGAAIAALMKLSFDEEHRHAMCQLGALHAIATLIQVDAEAHGSETSNQSCVTVRRYAGMALTNLTFGDSNNKALLCSLQPFMVALVAQLSSPSEDLRQVTASVLRNLSWRADAISKSTLRDVGAVSGLMRAAMDAKKESTLKSILSALWNLSAHCNMNKVEICAVEGALQYLVEMLSFQAPSRTLAIVENAGGILRNISSHVALREDYRALLREHNCLPLLLQQLKSPSLTVVSNACGTLWNLSARCSQDQRALWDLGAVPMLRSLVHSKHRMISMGASAALKNLLASRPDADIFDRTSRGMPTLLVRKRRALEQELDCTLSETCDNIESPGRWDSHESVTSTHSENTFDRLARSHHCHRSGSLQLMKRSGSNASTPTDANRDQNQLESQMQRLKLNESALSSVASSGNSIYNTNNTSVTSSTANGVTSTRCAEINPTPAKPELTQPKATEEKPVDLSSKLKNEQVEEKNNCTILERRKSSQREVSDETIVKSNSSTGQRLSNATTEDDPLMEEADVDMPTDYSLKYHEGGDNKTREELDERYKKQADYNLMVRYRSCKSPEGVSAEAELDQPTDYSLKYRESSGSEVEKRNSVDNRHDIENSGHYAETDLDEALDYYTEDKVQTYCTEGTPYAFSNATSMSDLRVSEVNVQTPEKIATTEPALDQPTDYSFKYRENRESEKENASVSRHDNETSSHYAETDLDEALDYYTEDKVQTYCTEGTPYAFSNATSMSDLRVSEVNEQTPEKLPKEDCVDGIKKVSSPVGSPAGGCPAAEPATTEISPKEEVRENKVVTFETPLMFSRSSSLGSLSNCEPPEGSGGCEFGRFASGVVSPYDLPDSPLQTGPSSPHNIKPSPQQPSGKVVTFETPLMFSRCSSLGSLSSCEPPDSSVVSEFSRFASGIVSPFELPDSPTQTGPPSPRNVKPLLQPPTAGKGAATVTVNPSSVFEDTVASFKEENTPQHFSTGTSLSSLTFDDEPSPLQQQMIKHQQQRNNNTSNSITSTSSSSVAPVSSSPSSNDTNSNNKDLDPGLAPVSEEEDEDDMLAACINIGMQNSNRQRSAHIKQAPLSRLPKPRHSGIPIKAAAGVNVTSTGHHQPNFNQRKLHNPQNQLIIDSEVNEDSTTEFCTEGTPANISHATSHSDLSMLCASSDDDHDNNMVAECIRSAMPQARNSKTAIKMEPLSSNNKQANEKQKEINDIRSKMQTPKSSPQQHNVPAQTAYNSPRVKDIKGIAAQDETECFAVEGSPCVFSTRSSLSDLTINSAPKCRDRCPVSPAPDDGLSPLSSLEPEVTVLSGGSLSGADEEEVEGEEEQALLEQCITSGMPPPAPSSAALTKNGRTLAAAEEEHTVAAKPTTAIVAPPPTVGDAPNTTGTGNRPPPTLNQTQQQHHQTIDRMKESVDTWNEDTSPNDVSFPSISVTTPLISSYKSALGDAEADADDDRTEADAYVSLPISTVTRALDEMSLTESSIIQLEEGKVAIIANMDMESSFMSDLESVRPPSAMGSLLSLTQSISEADRRKMPMRGLVARRALADSSLSWNNIDSIKPPSGMDELLDLENSILSVASITSEIADSPHSCSEDVTLAETSDTNLDLPQSPQPQKRITPKQKRQNVKDRYNTYTINCEHLQNGITSEATEAVTSTLRDDSEEQNTVADDDVIERSPKSKRVTPKQRRQADKDRFMTRTLGIEEQQQLNNLSPMPSLEMDDQLQQLQPQQQPDVTSTVPPSPPTTPRESLKSVDSDDLLSADEEEMEMEKAKPRVVKPSAHSVAEAKAIRGRKKVRSGIPISAKASPVMSPVQPSSKDKDKDKDKKTNSSIPPPTPPVLQRQGTFTKDEPTTPPPSGIPVLSKKASPIRTVKKKPAAAGSGPGGAANGSTTPGVRKMVGRGRAGSLPRTEPAKKPGAGAGLGVRSSMSNQSLKSEALGASEASLQQQQHSNSGGSTPRWSSNSNLNSAKKDATSKIASLWKKVEDSKRKDTVGGKDTRVWIAAPSKQAA